MIASDTRRVVQWKMSRMIFGCEFNFLRAQGIVSKVNFKGGKLHTEHRQ